MSNEILEHVDEWLSLINEFNFYNEVNDITRKINNLQWVLANGTGSDIAAVTKAIYDDTDFEGIEIKFRNSNLKNYVIIRKDALYMIDRLSVLGFKKIAKHELEQGIESFGKEAKTVYDVLKFELEKKKKGK